MKTKNKIPMRQCTGCREMKNKKEMIRVLKTAEDEIILDATGKKNGRGAYICKSRECLEKARKNLASIQGKLSNENFTARAPESVVNAEREKAVKAAALIAQLEQSEAMLKKL